MNATPARPRVSNDERGMALAIALFAIVVIGALVAGTAYAGRLEMTSGRSAVYATKSLEQAESGLTDVFANWDAAWNSLVTDDSLTGPSLTDASGRNRYSTMITRLGGNLFYIQSVGERLDAADNALSTRVLGQLARLEIPSFSVNAAVTANAEVRVFGSTTKVDGHDTNPPGWETSGECPAASGGVWGIQTSDVVTTKGTPDIDGVPGPTKVNDTTITPGMFDDPFDELAAMATITLPNNPTLGTQNPSPTTVGSPARCDKTNDNNWGEPLRNPPTGGTVTQCVSYFPVVYYPSPTGVLKMSNGRAQGIILSRGDIQIAGNFEFNGIILALGAVTTTGTGNKVTGAVISGNADISDDDMIGGTPTILYSSCTIASALNGAARALPLAQKSWVQRW
jgi:hypothetical protein